MSNASLEEDSTAPTEELALPKLVKKLAHFRKALAQERATSQDWERRHHELSAALKDVQGRLLEKDKQLLDLLKDNAQLKTQVHMISVEPLPSVMEKDVEEEVKQVFNGKSQKELKDEFKRLMKELSHMQYHHTRLTERVQADKVQSDHQRMLLQSELSSAKEALATSTRDLHSLREQNQALEAKLIELQGGGKVAIKGKGGKGEKKEVLRLTQLVADRERQLHEAEQKLREADSLASLYAQRAFSFKTKLESLELNIRRFVVWKIRPLMPAVAAQITIKKITSTGEVLLVIVCDDSPEEYSQDVSSIYEVHAVRPRPVLPLPAPNDNEGFTAMLNTPTVSSASTANNSRGGSPVPPLQLQDAASSPPLTERALRQLPQTLPLQGQAQAQAAAVSRPRTRGIDLSDYEEVRDAHKSEDNGKHSARSIGPSPVMSASPPALTQLPSTTITVSPLPGPVPTTALGTDSASSQAAVDAGKPRTDDDDDLPEPDSSTLTVPHHRKRVSSGDSYSSEEEDTLDALRNEVMLNSELNSALLAPGTRPRPVTHATAATRESLSPPPIDTRARPVSSPALPRSSSTLSTNSSTPGFPMSSSSSAPSLQRPLSATPLSSGPSLVNGLSDAEPQTIGGYSAPDEHGKCTAYIYRYSRGRKTRKRIDCVDEKRLCILFRRGILSHVCDREDDDHIMLEAHTLQQRDDCVRCLADLIQATRTVVDYTTAPQQMPSQSPTTLSTAPRLSQAARTPNKSVTPTKPNKSATSPFLFHMRM